MANALDCDIIVSKFELQSRYCIHFRSNILVLFVAASHQTGTDIRSKARRPIKVGIKGRGRSENEPRLELCWSMLLIDSLGAMWAWWGKQFHEPKCGSGNVWRIMAWTRQQGLVPYIVFEKVRWDLFRSNILGKGMDHILVLMHLCYRKKAELPRVFRERIGICRNA